MDIIRTEKLTKVYKSLTAVHEVDLTIRRGEIFGFLGPNGAGKTTFINMLCTLTQPSSGWAMVSGYDVCAQPDRVRESIGIVFQDPSLDDRLTAYENLDFHAILYGLPKTQRVSRITEVLHMVDLYDRRKDLVRTFSGGMKRRLEIARGLIHSPKVLFLDEPTIGLDPQTRSAIWEYIQQLRAREGITVFLTTHYMDEAEVCNRVAIIDHGQIITVGTPAELKSQVGADVLVVRSLEEETLQSEIQQRFRVVVHREPDGLHLEVDHGDQLLPKLMQDFGSRISGVYINSPTLNDVFLKLTGRKIREESGGEMDSMRGAARAWERRHRA